jgi:hypothetical protein
MTHYNPNQTKAFIFDLSSGTIQINFRENDAGYLPELSNIKIENLEEYIVYREKLCERLDLILISKDVVQFYDLYFEFPYEWCVMRIPELDEEVFIVDPVRDYRREHYKHYDSLNLKDKELIALYKDEIIKKVKHYFNN